jgi:hypothetical protein
MFFPHAVFLGMPIGGDMRRWTVSQGDGISWCFSICLVVISTGVGARPLPEDPLQRRCWLQHTGERTAPSLIPDPTPVTFSNLANGYAVRSPFWVEFGIQGMGVMPAGNKKEKTGHHHLLIDTPLPPGVSDPIPFSETHRHFGKGQTGTVLELPPGQHTLRLLFADYAHRPYFVFSPEIKVNVGGKRDATPAPQINAAQFEATCRAWYQDEMTTPPRPGKAVYVKNIRDGEVLGSPFLVKLGVIGFGVAPAGSVVKDAGYFVLNVSRNGIPVTSVSLKNGETEAVLDLASGDYDLAVEFLGVDGGRLLKEELPIAVVRKSQKRR